jgi:spermidine synthase
VALFTHPNPKNVLIIGGGDGGTLREVLRHKSVEKCVMVEIDEEVVNACKEFIPQTASEMTDNPRGEVLIEDGLKFVAETDQKFDVVLVDSTDPIGPAEPLFGKEFYSNVHKILTENGIVIAQGESPFWELETQASMLKNLKEVFELTKIYNYSNMSYPAACWSFVYASKGLCPVKDFDESRVSASGLEFKYYNKEIHRAAFALPEFQKKALSELIND